MWFVLTKLKYPEQLYPYRYRGVKSANTGSRKNAQKKQTTKLNG